MSKNWALAGNKNFKITISNCALEIYNFIPISTLLNLWDNNMALNKKTVFITGAGANKEFGMPLGSELKDKIISIVDEPFKYNNNVLHFINTRKEYNFLQTFRRNTDSLSIDDFVRNVQSSKSIDNAINFSDENFKYYAKLAIAIAILEHEENTYLSINDTSHGSEYISAFEKYKSNLPWLLELFTALKDFSTEGQIANFYDNLTIIDFNYDRVIERVLELELRLISKNSSNEIRPKILKPYGSLGDYDEMPYGARFVDSIQRIKTSAGHIKTYNESIDSNVHDEIKNAILHAEKIVFLGNAFHKQNLKILSNQNQSNEETPQKKIFCTVMGLPHNNLEIIENDLKKYIPNISKITFGRNDQTCADFMQEYIRAITA